MDNASNIGNFQIKVAGSPRPVINYELTKLNADNPNYLDLYINADLLRSKNISDYTVTQNGAPYEVVKINDNGNIITVTPQ